MVWTELRIYETNRVQAEKKEPTLICQPFVNHFHLESSFATLSPSLQSTCVEHVFTPIHLNQNKIAFNNKDSEAVDSQRASAANARKQPAKHTHSHKIIITLTDNCIFIACKPFDVGTRANQ